MFCQTTHDPNLSVGLIAKNMSQGVRHHLYVDGPMKQRENSLIFIDAGAGSAALSSSFISLTAMYS